MNPIYVRERQGIDGGGMQGAEGRRKGGGRDGRMDGETEKGEGGEERDDKEQRERMEDRHLNVGTKGLRSE